MIKKLKLIPVRRILILFFAIAGLSIISYAQEPPIPCDPDVEQCPEEPVPLDGGTGLLLAVGAAYGFKKLKDSYHKAKI